MQGQKPIIDTLNAILTAELTAVNQYFIHYKMCQKWGYLRLAHKKRAESVEEMVHAEHLIDRILFLEGVPNMQRLNSLRIGETPVEQHELDLQLELEAVRRLNDAVALCRDSMDGGTRELLERMLEDEEEAVDWLETQLHLVKSLGAEAYLAEQLQQP